MLFVGLAGINGNGTATQLGDEIMLILAIPFNILMTLAEAPQKEISDSQPRGPIRHEPTLHKIN